MPRAAILLFGLMQASCTAVDAPAPRAPRVVTSPAAVSEAKTGEDSFVFADSTRSPLPLAETSEDLAPFLELCDRADAALSRVAERFALRGSEGRDAPLDASEVIFALRAEGSPYVWPRAWALHGAPLEGAVAAERMQTWLRSFGDGGERRCGVARVSWGERAALVAIAVDALADLAPLPVRARAGAWLDVEATLLVPATEAKVIVLDPSGASFSVPTSFDGRSVRARFHADRPGAFRVQLLAVVAGGPRPVLEATVYADISPPRSFVGASAPGEPEAPLRPIADRRAALLEMLNRARATTQSPPLVRDPALDAVAQTHAEAMRRVKRVAHDTGDGDPATRVQAAALDVASPGENVAHAADVVRAHRALWASPSHRKNLLHPRFDKVGIGVAEDADGSIWVCEIFADTGVGR